MERSGNETAESDAEGQSGVAALFDRHHAEVWRYVFRLAGREAADDLLGEVFVRAVAGWDRFDPALGSSRAWLFGIATNLTRQLFRSERRARAAFERAAREAPTAAPMTEWVEDLDELKRLRRNAVSAIAACSADDRALLVMAVWERMTYSEIAAALGVPVGTVRSRLSRLRSSLRAAIDPDHRHVSMREDSR